MAALAAGTTGTAGGSAPAVDAGVNPAAVMQTIEQSGSSGGGSGAQSPAGAGSTAGKADRATKVRVAKAKAEEAKAAKAAKTKAGRAQAAKAKATEGRAAPGRAAGAGSDEKGPKRDRGKAPSMDKLMPNGTPGGQQTFTPSVEQMRNAEEIVDTGKKMNLSERAYVIAVATSLQESKLQNLGHLGARNDHDSLGLFQQRPSSGWGTPEQITDPKYAAEQFYKGLERVQGYPDMPLTRVAQTVQVSAFPDAYAQWEKMAADIVQATYGDGPYADIAAAADK